MPVRKKFKILCVVLVQMLCEETKEKKQPRGFIPRTEEFSFLPLFCFHNENVR